MSEEKIATLREERVQHLMKALIERVWRVTNHQAVQMSTPVPGLDVAIRDEVNATDRCVLSLIHISEPTRPY